MCWFMLKVMNLRITFEMLCKVFHGRIFTVKSAEKYRWNRLLQLLKERKHARKNKRRGEQ